jgi:hypothetical protein
MLHFINNYFSVIGTSRFTEFYHGLAITNLPTVKKNRAKALKISGYLPELDAARIVFADDWQELHDLPPNPAAANNSTIFVTDSEGEDDEEDDGGGQEETKGPA